LQVGLAGSVSTTVTESDTWFETQTSLPSGRTATETGSMPTSTVRCTSPVAVS